MTPERWQNVKKIFDEAVLLNGEPRQQFLRKECRGDDALLHEVTSLLLHENAGTGLLDGQDALQQAESILAQDEGTLAGRTIGAYRLLKKIGAGGMGTVYLAEQQEKRFKMQVALKIIKRGMDTDEIVARFQNERQILAALDHPNIARLFFAGTTDDGLPYFAMEFVDGKPLTAFCDANRYPVEKRLRLFIQVCRAVQYAHEKSIVHRDLKPGNILITQKGDPRLLDFGIAKLLQPAADAVTASLTRAGQKMMTPEYACPEQVTGKKITPASDVYALGVLLFELLTCSLPYSFENHFESTILRVVAETQPAKPSEAVTLQLADDGQTEAGTARALPENRRELRRKLRGDLDNIILKCLRKEPERRYPNAGALADDLQRYLKNLPVHAMPDSLAYRTNRLLRRKKKTIRNALIAFAFIAFATISGLLVKATFFPPPKVIVETDQEGAIYVEAGRTAAFSGNYLPDGIKISGLNLLCTVFAGPNKMLKKEIVTDKNGRFELVYEGSGGVGVDSLRIENVIDEPGEIKFAIMRAVHWMPKGTLFGPLGFPVGAPSADGSLLGGITCDGQRFSETPISAYGIVHVKRVHPDSLFIAVALKNGDPNFSYEIEVFESGDGCASSSLAGTGIILHADENGNGETQITLALPHAPPNHHVLGDGQGSEAMIVVLDWTDSPAGGDRFTTDPIPLPAFSGNSPGEPADARPFR